MDGETAGTTDELDVRVKGRGAGDPRCLAWPTEWMEFSETGKEQNTEM